MFHLPCDIKRLIYEYDNTYITIYKDCMKEFNDKKEAKALYDKVLYDMMCYFEYLADQYLEF